MTKLLISTSSFPPRPGGIGGKFVYELARSIMAHGDVEVSVCTPARKNSKLKENIDGIQVYRYKYAPFGMCPLSENAVISTLRKNWLNTLYLPSYVVGSLIEIYRIAIENRIDVFNSHWFLPQGLNNSIIHKIRKIPHLATLHAADVLMANRLPGNVGSNIAGFVYRNSNFILPVSEYIENQYLKLVTRAGIPKQLGKTIVIPMGTNTETFKPNYEAGVEAREKYGFSKDEFLIGYFGRLDEKKGVEYLLDTLHILHNQGFRFKAFIGGSGPLKTKLENIAKYKYKLVSKVKFLGFIPEEDMSRLYNAVDVVIIPSIVTKMGDAEGMPVVLMEAMACGKPVIISNISNITSVVQNGVTAFVVPPKNPNSIADSVQLIYNDLKTASLIGRNARKKAMQFFSWEVIGKQYYDIILKM